jgi:hypothetical protein
VGKMKMEYLNEVAEIIKQVILDPMNFFEKHKTTDWMELIKITAILTIIPAITTGIGISALSTLLPKSMLGNFSNILTSLGIAAIPLIYLIYLIINIIGIFVGAAILHIGIYLLGGRDIIKTAMVQVYASIPNYLLSWIPIIGFVVSIWSAILLIIGISKQHKMSYGKAVLATIISTIIVLAIVIIPVSIIIFSLGSLT